VIVSLDIVHTVSDLEKHTISAGHAKVETLCHVRKVWLRQQNVWSGVCVVIPTIGVVVTCDG
jgi:hypothetical protein